MDERFNIEQLRRENAPSRTRSRRDLRELRRQDRVANAQGEKARLDASWDYLRGVLRELERDNKDAADRVRREVTAQLMSAGARAARR